MTDISRINFGITFKFAGFVKPQAGKWSHSFVIALPSKSEWGNDRAIFLQHPNRQDETKMKGAKGVSDCILATYAGLEQNSFTQQERYLKFGVRPIRQNDTCYKVRANAVLLVKTALKAHETLVRLAHELDDSLPPEFAIKTAPNKRETEEIESSKPILPIIGDVASTLFGVATQDQLRKVIDHVNKLTKRQFAESGAVSVGLKDLSSFANATTNSLNRAMNELKSINSDLAEIHELRESLGHQMQYYAALTTKTIEIVTATADMSNHYTKFIASLQELGMGFLPRYLIPKQVLSNTVDAVKAELIKANQKFYLSETNPEKYYQKCDFTYVRIKDHLLINILFPLTNYENPFYVYETTLYPTPVPDNPMATLKLVLDSKAIAVTEDFFLNKENTLFFDLTETELRNLENQMSHDIVRRVIQIGGADTNCVLALMADDGPNIKQLCHYRVILDSFRPTLTHLWDQNYYSMGGEQWVIICNDTKHTEEPCNSCVLKVGDDCSFQNSLFTVAHLYHENGQGMNTVEKGHTVALALLQHFFPPESLSILNGQTLLDEEAEAKLPEIKIYKNPRTALLADDAEAALNLKKLTEQIKTDGQSVHTLADSLDLASSLEFRQASIGEVLQNGA